jgi:hypothetical protein
MNHNEIVSALEKTLPAINASADPESVLLKFASGHNLSPAQLEKLGQVFNTAKTLAYMDKKADARAGSFALLDVPALLGKYTDFNAGAASPDPVSARPSDWYETPSASKMAGAGEDIPEDVLFRTPDAPEETEEEGMLSILPPHGVEEEDDGEAVSAGAELMEALRKARAAGPSIDAAEQIIADHQDSLGEKVAAIREALSAEGFRGDHLVEDCHDIAGPEAVALLARLPGMEKAASFNPEGRRPRMVYDRTGLVEMVKAACEDAEVISGARKFCLDTLEFLNGELLKTANKTRRKGPGRKESLKHGDDPYGNWEGSYEPEGDATPEESKPAQEETPATPPQEPDEKQKLREQGRAAAEALANKKKQAEEDRQKLREQGRAAADAASGKIGNRPSNPPAGAPQAAPKPPMSQAELLQTLMLANALSADQDEASGPDYSAALQQLQRGYAATDEGLWSAFRGAAKATHGKAKAVDRFFTDSLVGRELKARVPKAVDTMSRHHKLDLRVLDHNEDNEQAAMALQELMITDPIIQQYDEDQVVEVFNALKELNPAIAGNKSLIRTVLREALQYDGSIPLQTQGELAKLYDSIRKGQMPARREKDGE